MSGYTNSMYHLTEPWMIVVIVAVVVFYVRRLKKNGESHE